MKDPRANMLKNVQKLTKETRERLGKDAFNLEAVALRITNAATEGLDICVVTPPSPVNLTQTEAAKALVAYLKEKGFRADWRGRRWTESGTETPELVISW